MNTSNSPTPMSADWSQTPPTQPGHYWFWGEAAGTPPRLITLTDVHHPLKGWWLPVTMPQAPSIKNPSTGDHQTIDPPHLAAGLKVNQLTRSLLKQALAYAIRQTTTVDIPTVQKAWLTRSGVYALYPAIYREMRVNLEEHGIDCTASMLQALPQRLYQEGLISKPRGFGVRQTRSTSDSILNILFEIDPDQIWGPGERRPELWYITPAIGQWYPWVANLVGLTSRPADQQNLYLHTVRAKPQQPPQATPNFVNPDVVLAIYWQVQEFEGDPDARSIWS